MLWLGGAINQADLKIKNFSNQTDLANTLLNQLKLPNQSDFLFSKNLLADSLNSFAVYVFNNGYGYVSNQAESIYDFDVNSFLKEKGSDTELTSGKVYMQKLFYDYNKK